MGDEEYESRRAEVEVWLADNRTLSDSAAQTPASQPTVAATTVVESTATSSPTPIESTPDPYMYDDFNDPEYEGKLNYELWSPYTNNASGRRVQTDGALYLHRNAVSGDGDVRILKWRDIGLYARVDNGITLKQDLFFEVKLKVPQPQMGTFGMTLDYQLASGNNQSICSFDGGTTAPYFRCSFFDYERVFVTDAKLGDYNIWYTARIEIDSTTMKQTYFLDGKVVGFYEPEKIEELKNSTIILSLYIGNSVRDYIIGYIDDVRFGEIE